MCGPAKIPGRALARARALAAAVVQRVRLVRDGLVGRARASVVIVIVFDIFCSDENTTSIVRRVTSPTSVHRVVLG